MIAKAFEFEYTCKVNSKDSKFKLNDGVYVNKQWFETEQAMLNSVSTWTKQGHNGVYTYYLTAENMENNSKVKAFPIDVYNDFSDAMENSIGMPKRFIVSQDFGYYATKKTV